MSTKKINDTEDRRLEACRRLAEELLKGPITDADREAKVTDRSPPPVLERTSSAVNGVAPPAPSAAARRALGFL